MEMSLLRRLSTWDEGDTRSLMSRDCVRHLTTAGPAAGL